MQLTKHWAAVLDDYVIDLAWSPDNTRLAAASAAGGLALFNGKDGAKAHVLPGHDNGTNCIAWSPSSASLASGGQDGKVKFWDALAGQHTGSVELGNAWIEHLAWRPAPPAQNSPPTEDKRPEAFIAAAAGRDLVFLRSDASLAHRFKPAPKTLSAIAWQPAGGCLAAAYFGGVCLWDADDFVAQKEFPYGNGIHALAWSPDNKWLVSGNQDPSVHLWIPETSVELHMSGYEGKVKELSFDHTSRWLATGGGKEACVWDCSGDGPEGREPVMLPHDIRVCAVAFQHSHGLLATASQDGVVMLWSPERKQPLRATVRMPHAATKLVWSPDDTLLAIGSEQGAVYVLKNEN
jgi:WD40 repeat protein